MAADQILQCWSANGINTGHTLCKHSTCECALGIHRHDADTAAPLTDEEVITHAEPWVPPKNCIYLAFPRREKRPYAIYHRSFSQSFARMRRADSDRLLQETGQALEAQLSLAGVQDIRAMLHCPG